MSSFMVNKQSRDSDRRYDRWREEERQEKKEKEARKKKEEQKKKDEEYSRLKAERERKEKVEAAKIRKLEQEEDSFKFVKSIKDKKDIERFNRLLTVFLNKEYQKMYKFKGHKGMNTSSGDEIAVIVNNVHLFITPNYINSPKLKKYIFIKGKNSLNDAYKELLTGLGVENTKGNQEFIKNVSQIFKMYDNANDLRKKLV